MEITKDTPVADLMTNRSAMVRLAQMVFDKMSTAYMRAITVFATNPNLGRVIDAKRNNVFDYGACIIEGPTGLRWPTDPNKTLEAIDKAEKGVITVDDLTPLFGGNRELAEAQFSKVVPGAKAEKTKKVSKPKDEVVEKPAPAPVEEKVVQFVPKEVEAPVVRAEAPVAPAPAPVVVFDTKKLEDQIALLGQGMAQLHDELTLGFQFLKTLAVIQENQAIINQNIKTLSEYLDPAMGLADLGSAPVINHTPVPEKVVEVAVSPTVEVSAKVVQQPVAQVDEDEEELEVTEELLGRLSVPDLVELANRLGLKVAGEPKYRSPILKRIRVAVGLPAVQD